MPTEGNHVIGVGAVGPSTMKADYSNWGTEQTDVAAPGGYFRDFFGTPQLPDRREPVLSAYPAVAREPRTASSTRTARRTPRSSSATARAAPARTTSTCRAPRWPSPHAVGVAALIVSRPRGPGSAEQRRAALAGHHADDPAPNRDGPCLPESAADLVRRRGP